MGKSKELVAAITQTCVVLMSGKVNVNSVGEVCTLNKVRTSNYSSHSHFSLSLLGWRLRGLSGS